MIPWLRPSRRNSGVPEPVALPPGADPLVCLGRKRRPCMLRSLSRQPGSYKSAPAQLKSNPHFVSITCNNFLLAQIGVSALRNFYSGHHGPAAGPKSKTSVDVSILASSLRDSKSTSPYSVFCFLDKQSSGSMPSRELSPPVHLLTILR